MIHTFKYSSLLLIASALASVKSFASVSIISDSFTQEAANINKTDGFVSFSDAGSQWHAATNSAWNHGTGNDWIYNTSNAGGSVSDGALVQLVDLSTLGLTSAESALDVSFKYVSWNGTTPDNLYVHLWGIVDKGAVGTDVLANMGAQNGNMWAGTDFAKYDIYGLDDGAKFTITQDGGAGNAAISLVDFQATASATFADAATYTNQFDLSGHTIVNLAGYDYLLIGFTRDPDVGTSNGFALYDVSLTGVPEPSSSAILAGLLGLFCIMLRRR